MLLAEFGTGQVFWSFVWFTMFFIWIWLLIIVFGDIFRSPDLGGWTKAIWTIFIILVPYLGVFVYLIARGHKMSEHAVAAAAEADTQQRAYIQSVVAKLGQPDRRAGQGRRPQGEGPHRRGRVRRHEGQDPRELIRRGPRDPVEWETARRIRAGPSLFGASGGPEGPGSLRPEPTGRAAG